MILVSALTLMVVVVGWEWGYPPSAVSPCWILEISASTILASSLAFEANTREASFSGMWSTLAVAMEAEVSRGDGVVDPMGVGEEEEGTEEGGINTPSRL